MPGEPGNRLWTQGWMWPFLIDGTSCRPCTSWRYLVSVHTKKGGAATRVLSFLLLQKVTGMNGDRCSLKTKLTPRGHAVLALFRRRAAKTWRCSSYLGSPGC